MRVELKKTVIKRNYRDKQNKKWSIYSKDITEKSLKNAVDIKKYKQLLMTKNKHMWKSRINTFWIFFE